MVIQRPSRSCLLTVNGGSSSLKLAIFPLDAADPPRPLIRGRIERIGLSNSQAVLTDPNSGASESMAIQVADLGTAAGWLIDWVDQHVGWTAIAAIAHRVVHGGANTSARSESRRSCSSTCAGSLPWIPTTFPARSN